MRSVTCAGASLLISSAPANAATEASAQDLAREKHNPFTQDIDMLFQFSTSLDAGPGHGTAEGINFQPKIPFAVGEDWSLFERATIATLHNPSPENRFGLGDLEIESYLTPSLDGKWVWGVGPVLQCPTATDANLGTGKWSVGPGAGVAYVAGPWVDSLLVNQLWSFAGDANRPSVSVTSIEPSFSYSFTSGWSVTSDLAMNFDWHASHGKQWSIPLGLDFGKVFRVGVLSVSWQLGAYYFVARQEEAADWMFRLQVSISFPRHLRD